MATEETNIQQKCRIEASACGARVFRNNRGLFMTLDGARKVRAGLEVPGSSDLIGWKSVTITPDMVGKTVAVFCAPEVKRPGQYPTKDQERFIGNVNAAGGIAGVVRSPEDMRQLLARPLFWT